MRPFRRGLRQVQVGGPGSVQVQAGGDVVRMARRGVFGQGPHCQETARVGSQQYAGESGTLLCDLTPGHGGVVHHDPVDGVWWALQDPAGVWA